VQAHKDREGELEPLRWEESGYLVLLDQRKLPGEISYVSCEDYQAVVRAIRDMQVRGAPAIGTAAAYGMVLAALGFRGGDVEGFYDSLAEAADRLKSTRPTAINLAWAVERMFRKALALKRESLESGDFLKVKAALLEEAHAIAREDVEANKRIGELGAGLIASGESILTHCNAGALATVGYGTALGILRSAAAQGKVARVYACETRPLLQGARLTALELSREGIPVTVITDNMAGYVMRKGLVNRVVVGADRIAGNGDVANKVGTYTLAVLAKTHGLPFYVAAPTSTIDLGCRTGEEIPIEQRPASEVTHICGRRVVPEGVDVLNPAFDVTPHELVSAIITERGIAREPYVETLKRLVNPQIFDQGGHRGCQGF